MGVMVVAYGIIIVAFAPLFIYFILLLKRHFDSMYRRMKIKLYASFVIFMLVMGFRFFIYTLIQFSNGAWLNVETLDGEIPLYVSEIFIALCYMYLMVSMGNKQK